MTSASVNAWMLCILVAYASRFATAMRPLESKEVVSPEASAVGVTLMQASMKHSKDSKLISAEDAAGARELAILPTTLDDSMLSTPAVFAYMVQRASGIIVNTHSGKKQTPERLSLVEKPTSVGHYVARHWGVMLLELFAFMFGVLILWFNERRSVKMDTLLSRGLSECESIDTDRKLDDETVGRLVHVQGRTVAQVPVEDPQFQNAAVNNCLKLQSTVEVYEWVQTLRINQNGPTRDSQQHIQHSFHKEWTTVHHNSLQFQRNAGKPAPDNPRLPRGLSLGTFTSICKNVQLGGFTLPDDMTEQVGKFKPASHQLPPTLQGCGLTLYVNKDGYFYSRPTARSMWNAQGGGPASEPMVGDVRVRFLSVAQGDATVVAVHCETGGVDTFVPYRAIPRGCCTNESRDRQRLIEEGARSLQEIKDTDQELAPCIKYKSMIGSCFCCPCSTIQNVCTQEVVTEEIYHISEELDPIEKAFDYVVPRNCVRAWVFRALGWFVCYFTCIVSLSSYGDEVAEISVLRVYGRWAVCVLAAVIATSASALVMSMVNLCYSPAQSMKWALAMAIVICLPLVVGRARSGVLG